MNHAITVGGSLLAFVILIGLGAAAFGALMVFAGGMSDDPAGGDETTSAGCVLLIGGAAVAIIGIVLAAVKALA